jgi:hypothetical protein
MRASCAQADGDAADMDGKHSEQIAEVLLYKRSFLEHLFRKTEL